MSCNFELSWKSTSSLLSISLPCQQTISRKSPVCVAKFVFCTGTAAELLGQVPKAFKSFICNLMPVARNTGSRWQTLAFTSRWWSPGGIEGSVTSLGKRNFVWQRLFDAKPGQNSGLQLSYFAFWCIESWSLPVLEAVHSVIGIQKIEFDVIDVHGIAFLTMLSDLCTPFKFADTFNARVVEGVGQLDSKFLKSSMPTQQSSRWLFHATKCLTFLI